MTRDLIRRSPGPCVPPGACRAGGRRPGPVGRTWVALLLVAAFGAAMGAVPACGGERSGGTSRLSRVSREPIDRGAGLPPTQSAGAAPDRSGERYAQAVDAAQRRGMGVWISADLVKRWSEGPAAFQTAVSRVAALSRGPGVLGVKIGDELGYQDTLDSPARLERFLLDSATTLRAAAPGKMILIDLVVPQLGCLPGTADPTGERATCLAAAGAKYPQLALDKVDGYLGSGRVDVVNLSTGLRGDQAYRSWNVTVEQAQTAAWAEVARRDWGRRVQLRSRKALAHAGTYQGTVASAESEATVNIDIPAAFGARAGDIWAWRQWYDGEFYRLMDPGNTRNALWAALEQRRARRVHLSTNFSPTSVERGLDADLDVIASVFTEVLIAAGTG